MTNTSSSSFAPIPPESSRHKDEGGAHFSAGRFDEALASYHRAIAGFASDFGGSDVTPGSAAASSPDTRPRPLEWSAHERFVLACRSNAALCLLRLGRYREAADECAHAAALPCFPANAPEALRAKVISRRMEALVGLAEGAGVDEAWEVMDEAILRGYLSASAVASTRRNFLSFAASLGRAGDGGDEETEAERAFNAIADRLVRRELVSAADVIKARECLNDGAVKVRERLASTIDRNDNEAEKESLIRRLSASVEVLVCKRIDALLPPSNGAAANSIGGICREAVTFVMQAGMFPPEAREQAVARLRSTLRDNSHHISAIDRDGTGYLMWAICYGLESSNNPSGLPTDMFLALLALFVDELGALIDQRAPIGNSSSRTPLQYIAKAGSPRAMHAMLDRGADPNLRDDEGWTPLMACCMNDIRTLEEGGPSDADRVETARLLVDAGADINAANGTGFTALHTVACSLHPPLIEFLLSRGADPLRRSAIGFTAQSLVERSTQNHPEKATECRLVLESVDPSLWESDDVKMTRFGSLLDDVLVSANNRFFKENPTATWGTAEGMRQRAEQEQFILSALLNHVGMDPALLSRQPTRDDGNWLGDLHRRISDLIPDAYCKVYLGPPTDEEIAIITSISGKALNAAESTDESGARYVDRDKMIATALRPWRQRGRIADRMFQFNELVADPVQHQIGFAIPSEAALAAVERHGPVVEVGAGTGYWSAVLQARGVDVVAFDREPPTDAQNSAFFSRTFTDVSRGDGCKIFSEPRDSEPLSHRTLLIVWPNNADKEDNRHLVDDTDVFPPVWDTDCLSCYIRAGGQTVIYVGEREEMIKVVAGAPSECGVSSSRRFQELLKEHFQLVEQHDCPGWSLQEDDATVWKRR